MSPRPPYAEFVVRAARILSSDHLYHLTARGVSRRSIFHTDNDCRQFLRTLAETVFDRAWRCHAYCLMGNHYHLLLDTPKADLPEGMRDLNSAYATRFNTVHESDGHVFQGRYDARIIRRQEHALQVARYIPLNPVRAKLCDGPERWIWSSYRATAGLAPAPAFLTTNVTLGWFGGDGTARARYRDYVGQGATVADPEVAALAEILSSRELSAAHTAHAEYGYSLRTIAAHLGVHHTTLARRLEALNAPKGV
jgi:REP element-mobilizing transposase RayT